VLHFNVGDLEVTDNAFGHGAIQVVAEIQDALGPHKTNGTAQRRFFVPCAKYSYRHETGNLFGNIATLGYDADPAPPTITIEAHLVHRTTALRSAIEYGFKSEITWQRRCPACYLIPTVPVLAYAAWRYFTVFFAPTWELQKRPQFGRPIGVRPK
jgi:hypothetical protein